LVDHQKQQVEELVAEITKLSKIDIGQAKVEFQQLNDDYKQLERDVNVK
jgi:hypothetical protein